MSDAGVIVDYLEYSKKALEEGDQLEAAHFAYWSLQYCNHGEPYGLDSHDLYSYMGEAEDIYRKTSKNFKPALLSKTTFVCGTICDRLLWLYKNKYSKRVITPETQKKFDGGHVIGSLAQKLFPEGTDASLVWEEEVIDMSRIHLPFNLKQHLWIDKTKKNFKDTTVYEAAFIYDDVFAAVDILVPGQSSHMAYEVKASKAISDTFIKDCALQYYVISHNTKIDDFFLVYLNEEYLNEIDIPLTDITESNVDIKRLFTKESVLERILPLQKDVAEKIKRCKTILSKREPETSMGKQCSSPYDCMYKEYCRNKEKNGFSLKKIFS